MIGFKLEFDTIADAIEFLRRLAQPSDVPPATKDDFNALEEKIMSALSDAVGEVSTALDQAVARVQALIDAGGGSPEVIAELNSIRDRLNNLAVETPPPPAP